MRAKLADLVDCATREYSEYSTEMAMAGNYGMESLGEYVADYLLRRNVVVLPEDIGLQKSKICEYENEFDEVAKDLFKIDEEFSGGAKVWVRTDVYKKLMRILALSNYLVKALRIFLTREEKKDSQ